MLISTRKAPSWIGVTTPGDRFGVDREESRIHLAYEKLAPLISEETSLEDKLMTQFDVAVSLVHELAHAMWHRLVHSGRRVTIRLTEAYFEDESVAELGWSLINAVSD
jgi:hypothetical protein